MIILLFALVALALCQRPGATLTANFSPAASNGLSGSIVVQQNGIFPTVVTIQSKLDFKSFNWGNVRQAYPMCMNMNIQFAWHVHVTWTGNNQNVSGFLNACSNASTNGHYDLRFACGPNSQYAPDPRCAGKITKYNCTKASFAQNKSSCELGDLSGRQGPLTLTNGLIQSKVVDEYFPPMDKFNLAMPNFPAGTQWNWILHLVCPEAQNPRLLCAVMKRTA